MNTVATAVRRLTVLAALFLLAGCNKDSSEVTGKVKLGDKLLSIGTVTFQNTQTNAIKSAPIGADGTYTVSIAPGPCKVTVTTPPPAGGMPDGMQMDPSKMGASGKTAAKTAEPIEVPSKYTSMTTTPLSFTVEAGKAKFDIAMTSEPKAEP